MDLRPLLAGIMLMGTAPTPDLASNLNGVWSGGRHVLTIADSGLRLESDCALAEFAPVQLDHAGRFSVKGAHNADTAGPQVADDRSPKGKPATLEGSYRDKRLEMVLNVEGMAPQHLSLQPGQRIKLIRCL